MRDTAKLVQDYMDDRLSNAARAEFEARLAREPELARQVEEYRALGHALREGGAELPAGFHARARARFEDSFSQDRQPGGARPAGRLEATGGSGGIVHRLVSWPGLGLAAATLLLAVVFLPQMVRERVGTAPPAVPTAGSSGESKAAPEEQSLAEADLQNLRTLGYFAGAEKNQGGDTIEEDVIADRDKETGRRQVQEGQAKEQAAPMTAGPSESATTAEASKQNEQIRDEKRKFAKTEVTAGESVAVPAPVKDSAAPLPAPRAASAGTEAPPSSPSIRAATLPADSLPACVVRIVRIEAAGRADQPEARQAEDAQAVEVIAPEVMSPAIAASIRALEVDYKREQVILVAPRGVLFDCESARFDLIDGRAVLTIAATSLPGGATGVGTAESFGGCAFVIPLTSLQVEIRDPVAGSVR